MNLHNEYDLGSYTDFEKVESCIDSYPDSALTLLKFLLKETTIVQYLILKDQLNVIS